MSRRHRQKRFTLIELLVAALAAAVLMAALLTSLSGAWRLQEQSQRREEETVPRDLARELLTADLLAAVPPAGVLAGPLTATAADEGDWRHDDVEWVTAVGARNPDDAGGDLVQVHYYLVEADTEGLWRLVRTERRNLLVVEEDDPPEVTVLDRVISFKATWYDGTDWADSWDSSTEDNQLPEAAHIRIDFAAADGKQAEPPPLEVVVPFLMRTASAEGGTP